MFYYGYYRDDRMKTRKGIEAALSDFEAGAIERGMSLIAFSQIDFPHLMGWRYFVCGNDVELLICEYGAASFVEAGFSNRTAPRKASS